MNWQRRKIEVESNVVNERFNKFSENVITRKNINKTVLFDYFRFAFFCMLLLVPIYAIAKSAIKHDWIMMIIDALLVPVGFVHGLLMLFNFIN
jgi:hypothetical protein